MNTIRDGRLKKMERNSVLLQKKKNSSDLNAHLHDVHVKF